MLIYHETTKGPEKMIQKSKKAGSFDVQSHRDRKRINLMSVEEVATAFEKESRGGV